MTTQSASAVTVDLDELEALAKAADFEWELTKHGLADEEGSGFREYAKAFRPTVALALLQELRAHRERAASGGWHPDSELPPDGRIVLVAGDGFGFMAVAFRMGDHWYDGARTDTADGEHQLRKLVTHWHELPEDPAPPASPVEDLRPVTPFGAPNNREPVAYCSNCTREFTRQQYHAFQEWQCADCGGLVKALPAPPEGSAATEGEA